MQTCCSLPVLIRCRTEQQHNSISMLEFLSASRLHTISNIQHLIQLSLTVTLTLFTTRTYPAIGEIGPKCENKGDKDHEKLNHVWMLNDSHGIIISKVDIEKGDGKNQNDGGEQRWNLCLGHGRSMEATQASYSKQFATVFNHFCSILRWEK